MTLVVCKIINDNLYIESDSKLTLVSPYDGEKEGQPRFCSILKTAIIHPSICISYAGHVQNAEDALKECLKAEIKDTADNIIDILLNATKSKNNTEFALGLISNSKPILIKIANGKTEIYDKSILWLGSSKAYDLFEKKYDELIKSKIPEGQSLQVAFDSVIENKEIEVVDHFHISVSIDKTSLQQPAFHYEEKVIINLGQATMRVGTESTLIPFGTTENGASGASYFVSVSPEFPGVAVHFPFENMGILFCPQIALDGKYFKHVQGEKFTLSGKEFLEKIKEKYGIPMRGFAKHGDSSMILLDTSVE